MKRIIYIRQSPKGGCDGTATYCQSLFDFFHDDKDCMAEEIKDYPEIKSRIFHYYYKPKALSAAIKKSRYHTHQWIYCNGDSSSTNNS